MYFFEADVGNAFIIFVENAPFPHDESENCYLLYIHISWRKEAAIKLQLNEKENYKFKWNKRETEVCLKLDRSIPSQSHGH